MATTGDWWYCSRADSYDPAPVEKLRRGDQAFEFNASTYKRPFFGKTSKKISKFFALENGRQAPKKRGSYYS